MDETGGQVTLAEFKGWLQQCAKRAHQELTRSGGDDLLRHIQRTRGSRKVREVPLGPKLQVHADTILVIFADADAKLSASQVTELEQWFYSLLEFGDRGDRPESGGVGPPYAVATDLPPG